jgi:dTDP-4-amino-4,6-dideoxygalactose transaminase
MQGDTKLDIPFNRPSFVGDERRYVEQALAAGHLSGNGAFTRRCEALLAGELGALRVLLTTSCTHALEMAALLLDVGPGDEVVVPSFTFVSSANAFVMRGARPVFADVRPDTLDLDARQLERLLTPRTRAIVAVHYAGVACDMDEIVALANRHGVEVVEDNAHGLFGRYRDRALGTIGTLAALSFHETKNVSCGEGGALVVNHARYLERAEILRDKGTDRGRFFRGKVDRYTWVDLGSSWVMSDLLAAVLLAQLEARERVQAARRTIWRRYQDGLSAWAEEQGVGLPTVPADCEQAFHLFFLVLPTHDARQRLIAHLGAHGILSVFHYVPLHLSPMGRRFGGRAGDCPVAESTSDRLLRLPLFYSLGEAEQTRILEAILAFPM